MNFSPVKKINNNIVFWILQAKKTTWKTKHKNLWNNWPKRKTNTNQSFQGELNFVFLEILHWNYRNHFLVGNYVMRKKNATDQNFWKSESQRPKWVWDYQMIRYFIHIIARHRLCAFVQKRNFMTTKKKTSGRERDRERKKKHRTEERNQLEPV